MRYLDVVLADRPFGVWPLDEMSGAVAQGRSALGNATYAGTITYRVPGPSAAIPYGIATNTSDTDVTMPIATGYLGGTQPQSFEIWLKYNTIIDSASAISIPWSSTTTVTGPMVLGVADTLLANEVMTQYNFNGGSEDTTGHSGFIIPAGWNHHVVAYGGAQGNWEYYLNGSQIGVVGQASGGAFGFTGMTFRLARSTSARFAVPGIAFPVIYNHRLSGGQILRHYQSGLYGATVRRPLRRAA